VNQANTKSLEVNQANTRSLCEMSEIQNISIAYTFRLHHTNSLSSWVRTYYSCL